MDFRHSSDSFGLAVVSEQVAVDAVASVMLLHLMELLPHRPHSFVMSDKFVLDLDPGQEAYCLSPSVAPMKMDLLPLIHRVILSQVVTCHRNLDQLSINLK